MDRSTKTKFVFVFIVGMVLSIILLNNVFGGKQDPLEFEEPIDESNYTELSMVDSEDKENRAADEGNEQTVANEKMILEEPNFEDEYEKKFGTLSVMNAKEVSKKAVTMWLEQETNIAKWVSLSTSSFLDTVQKEIMVGSDGTARKVTGLELRAFSSNSEAEGTIKFGVVATWNILNGENVVGNQTGLFYVTLSSSNGKWLVTEITEPYHENH